MFQTVEEFLQKPFGKFEIKSNEYERMFQKLNREKRIIIAGYTTIDDSYLLHIKIGSETYHGEFYDVVIMFFTDDIEIKKQRTLQNYYIKLFSNSPSFIYKYAVLYKEQGFLIDLFYEKLDPEYADKKPEKTNAEMKLSYDKSIYCTIRYLYEYRFIVLAKFGMILQKRKTPEKFLSEIKNFADVKFLQDFKRIEKTVAKQLKEKKDIASDTKSKKPSSNNKVRVISNSSKKVATVPAVQVKKKKKPFSSHVKKVKITGKKE